MLDGPLERPTVLEDLLLILPYFRTCACGVLRSYYVIYVYYGTYDLTWYAYYGWIWTITEADFGVFCASAPALKIFFSHYFHVKNPSYGSRGYKISGSGGKSSGYTKGSFVNSLRTFGASEQQDDGAPDGTFGSAVPLDRIHVKTGMDIVVENRGEAHGRRSDSSEQNLTIEPIMPLSTFANTSQWGSMTTCGRGSANIFGEHRHIERQSV